MGIMSKVKTAKEYAKKRWQAFAWIHLVPPEIRSRYKRTLDKLKYCEMEVQRLRLLCDELERRSESWQEAAEKWEEAYRFAVKAYDELVDEVMSH